MPRSDAQGGFVQTRTGGLLGITGAGGPKRPKDQDAPDREPGEKAYLPRPAKLDVRKPLIAEPKPAFADIPYDAEIITDERADDDEQRDPEEHIHEESLAFRLAAANRRGEKQGRADPRQADPDNWRLNVDIPEEVEGQEAIDRDAVKARPVRVIVGHDRTDEDLQQQHAGHDEKVLADPPLARGQWAKA